MIEIFEGAFAQGICVVDDGSVLGTWIAADLEFALTCDPMRVVAPAPWVGHLPFAYWLVRTQRPGTLVELGTHSGNSYFAFCQTMAMLTPTGRAYAVDTWVGDEHAGHYGKDVYASVAAFNSEHFNPFSTLLRSTFDDARSYFADGSVDLLHIDGMHTYDAVRHDFETWQSALSARAVVVFHDINVRERGFGVWRFWEEVRQRFPSFTFHHSHGLGVLGVGAEQSAALQTLFALGESAAAGTFRACLAARGEAFQRKVEVADLRAAAGAERRRAVDHDAALQREVAARTAVEARDAEREAATRSALEWHNAILSTQRELIASKDMAVARLEHTVAARTHALAARDQVIASRDSLAAQLLADFRHQRFLAGEERRVRDEMQQGYEKAISMLNRHREELQHYAERIRQDREERRVQEIADAVRQAREDVARAVTQSFVASTSWKVTRPLRVAKRLLRGGDAAPPGSLASLPSPPAPPALAFEPLPEAKPPEAEATSPTTDDPGSDVTAPTRLKLAFRTLLAARLQTFLSGPSKLRLPRADTPDVSIILVLFNQAELTFACLCSIVETLADAAFGAEVVIADNGSTDDTVQLLERLDGATILRSAINLHFLRAVNLAAQSARGRTLLLLNNDAQLLPGSLAAALRTLDSDPAIGAVGGRIILPDGTLQEAGSIVWRDGTCSGYARGREPTAPEVMFQRDVDYCSGAFLLTPAALFRDMGKFDERYAPAYYEEADYCVRLWEGGRRVVYDPDAAIIHYEFGSSTKTGDALRLQAANHEAFVTQHRAWLSRQFPASALNALPASRAQTGALRVLVMEDRVPHISLGSGYPRSNRLVQALVDAGADVSFFPMTRFIQTWPELRSALDKRVEVMITGDKAELHEYLVARPKQFDAFVICRPHNMEAFLQAVGPQRELLGGGAIIYDAEALFVTRDLQNRELEGNPASPQERHAMVAQEVSLTRLADTILSVSPAEQETMEEYGAREVHLLGFALDDAPLPTAYAERDQIVFLGAITADDLPNAEAVRWFASDILPPLREALGRRDLRLTVIGVNKAKTVAALDGISVDLVGMVDDLAPALSRSLVMVVPSRRGAGIPLKAQQAAMLGIPLVTTTLIADQLGWTSGVELLAADDPAAFAEACARLCKDQALWETLRKNALDRVRRDCSPQAFAATVKAVLAGVRRVHREPERGSDYVPLPSKTPTPPAEPLTGRPVEHDWSVAVPFGYVPAATQPRLGVICHLFHTSTAAEFLYYLRCLPLPADLFLSTDTPEKAAELRDAFAAWGGGSVEVRVVPNRGRDIAPKLVGFADVHGRYDLVLHLHSKMSSHAAFLAPWRSYLLETLLGSPEVVRSILDAFTRLPDLGMVAPQHFEAVRRWLGWNGNYASAAALAKRMGVTLSNRRALDFPSGSMFWARPAALQPLLDLNLSFDDFPAEDAQLDHTPAHAIERLFFYSCERSGHSWLKVAQPALMFDTRTIAEIIVPADLSRFAATHGVMLSGPAPIPTRDEPAPLIKRIPPGLAARLANRPISQAGGKPC